MSVNSEKGKLTSLLKEKFGESITGNHCHRGDETVVVERSKILELCTFLRDDPRCKFEMMIDISAVDYMPREPRFEVVYHFKSLTHGHRIRVKVELTEADPSLDSISELYLAVDWYERECWDMYGINFNNHPNQPKMRRLLTYESFVGHPLRKDYPVDKQQPLIDLFDVEERYSYERN